MTKVDTQRLEKLRSRMKDDGLDALICKLPENVVYLTNYWPHHGFSFVVFPQEGQAMLYVPEIEEPYADRDWAEVGTFGWGLLKDGDLYANYRQILEQLKESMSLGHAKIGIERTIEITGPTYRSAEPVVPAEPWVNLIEEIFNEASLVDVAALIADVRAIKTSFELDKMRVANQIAEMGMRAFLDQLSPGMTEVEVGALVEGTIRAEGPGYKGAKLVRASAEVGAGPIGSTNGTLLVPSSTRNIDDGDIVMVELATVVDGYWSDLTYMAVAGERTDRQREVYNTVLEAQQAAAANMKEGASFEDPDRAARAVLKDADLDKYFPHITGHAVGYRYHEFIPVLMPGAAGTLKQGMVSSVEPGVYIPEFGGIRIEDNVAVGKDGPDFLSTPREPWK